MATRDYNPLPQHPNDDVSDDEEEKRWSWREDEGECGQCMNSNIDIHRSFRHREITSRIYTIASKSKRYLLSIIVVSVLVFAIISSRETFKKKCARLDFACHIDEAYANMLKLKGKQSKTVDMAVHNYRKRYKREPPAGFRDWVEYALHNNANLIDEYDQLEADLAPFRNAGLTKNHSNKLQAQMRQLWNEENGVDNAMLGHVQIRNGNLTVNGTEIGPMSATTVRGIIAPIADRLPDLDILYNFYAQGRLFYKDGDPVASPVKMLNYSQKPTLEYLRKFCPQARISKSMTTRHRTSLDICERQVSTLQNRHGFFEAPINFFPVEALVPMISRAKMSTMTDLLAANPCYASGAYRQWNAVDKIEFNEKNDSVFWKGAATGIWIDNEPQWNKGQRQRFVSAIDAMKHIANASIDSTVLRHGENSFSENQFIRQSLPLIKDFNSSSFDVGFTRLSNCDGSACENFNASYPVTPRESPTNGYKHKLVADIDGQGMSCRFYRQLDSNSVPIKQTMWLEWHDDRIMPWLHYIPLSLEMDELPLLMHWLLMDVKGKQYASFVAKEGAHWAAKTLRKVDITIHYYRLLLEYASLLL